MANINEFTAISHVCWVWGPSRQDFGVEEPKYLGVYCEGVRSGPHLVSLTRVRIVY
jgi:hypothetical protein